MKDFKELINIADVYGTETKGLAEKREAEIQKHLDEGIWRVNRSPALPYSCIRGSGREAGEGADDSERSMAVN